MGRTWKENPDKWKKKKSGNNKKPSWKKNQNKEVDNNDEEGINLPTEIIIDDEFVEGEDNFLSKDKI